MDVDDAPANVFALVEQSLIHVVIDTNVFISGDELKAIDSLIEWSPLPGKNFHKVIVVVPWVVLQELDHLKNNPGCAKGARKAVAFLNQRFCAKKPGIRGQTILEAAVVIEGLNIEISDDRILQCCFFFKNSPGRHKTVLFSKDSNLVNKALVNHIETFSTFAALVKHILQVNQEDSPGYDQSQTAAIKQNGKVDDSPSDFTRNIIKKNLVQSSPVVVKKALPSPPPSTPIDRNDVTCSINKSLRESLGYILTQEMIAAYGKDLWLDIVLKKPPWSLRDVLTCLKKHWLAVFSEKFDRLLEGLVDTALLCFKTPGKEDEDFLKVAYCGLELVKGLAKKYLEDEIIKTSISKVQKSITDFKSPYCTTTSSSRLNKKPSLPPPHVSPSKAYPSCQKRKPLLPTPKQAPFTTPSKSNCSSPSTSGCKTKSLPSSVRQARPSSIDMSAGDSKDCHINTDSPSSGEDVVFEELNDVTEEDSAALWRSLDEIWTCIIRHSALIFKSVNCPVESAPSEIHTILATTPDPDLPRPDVAIQAIPLLSELINSFLSALRKFLSSYEIPGSSPGLKTCFDFLQTLWTITKAFNMPSNIESIKPTTVLQSCLSVENRDKLVNGLNKLDQVSGLLNQCACHFIQIS